MANVLVDRARPEDEAALATIYADGAVGIGASPPIADRLAAYREAVRNEIVLVARLGSTVGGFIAVVSEQNYIHHLYIAEHARGRGLGTALLQAGAALCKQPARLGCLRSNVTARAFYRRRGWRELGTQGDTIYFIAPKTVPSGPL